MSNNGRISFGDEISPERRKAEFSLHTIRSQSTPQSVFTLAIPNQWRTVQAPAGLGRPDWEALAGFARSDAASVHVIQGIERFEINLVDWLEAQCRVADLTITAHETGATEFGPMVHAAGTSKEEERLRFVVAADGPTIFWLVGRCVRQEPRDTDAVLGLCAASFLFSQHSGQTTRERLHVFKDERIAFRLLYPESWRVEIRSNDLPVRSAVDFRIVGGDDSLAYLRVATEKPGGGNLETIFGKTVEELEASGIRVDDLQPIPEGPRGGQRERWVGACKLPAGPGQVALLFRPAPHGWLTAVLLSPTPERNLLAWMRAKRFYEIVAASLTPA